MWERVNDKARIDKNRTHITAYLGDKTFLVSSSGPQALTVSIYANNIKKCLKNSHYQEVEESEKDDVLKLIRDWAKSTNIKIAIVN